MAPTPSKSNYPQLKTPQSKRLHFNSTKVQPSPNPNSAFKDSQPEHPVEVIGRIRDYPDRKEKPQSVLHVHTEQNSVRVRADVGYRDFSLDGISQSEEEDLDSFYKKFVQSRINGVKLGDKCTIMMYGPTGSGKSHTMFGCSKQPGIVYRSLRDILGDECEENDSTSERVGLGTFVQVTVLEIYNEEIYDLLTNSSSNGGGLGVGLPKGSASKVRLEVMGKKAKNATYMSGNEAGKISKEIQKVEKKRIVKSTLCNDRSSRSHCMIILDVPTVGGRLMLVDMAGSENIEQAGQGGFEAKMQTAKINQGNTALKRVVESIANGDSHVPFRDSKLTMLLQDSFEDDKSKILMILCASPDPKEIHKTISTLEYGAKAKCIVRGLGTMIKDKNGPEDSSSAVILGSRIQAMDEFIYKLQQDNKLIEKERNAAQKELLRKEKEIAELKVKLERMEEKSGSGKNEEEIISKVNEQTQILKLELENKMERCQRIANDFVDLERRRMEEWILQQQNGFEMLKRRLEEVEYELCRTRDANGDGIRSSVDGNRLARSLMGIYASGDGGMVKSMDLDMDDQEPSCREIKLVGGAFYQPSDNGINGFLNKLNEAENDSLTPNFEDRVRLSTVFEEEEEEEKEVIEEKKVCTVKDSSKITQNLPTCHLDEDDRSEENSEASVGSMSDPRSSKEVKSFRKLKIQNIFTLCGNQRELSQQVRIPGRYRFENVDPQFSPLKIIGEVENDMPMPELSDQIKTDTTMAKSLESTSPVNITVKPVVPVKEEEEILTSGQLKMQLSNGEVITKDLSLTSEYKENYNPSLVHTTDEQIEVHVKWEDSKENPGNTITTLKVLKNASLADLRKLIEIYIDANCKGFSFVAVGDLSGGVIPREKEGTSQAIIKLPSLDNHSNGFLACLRPMKHQQSPDYDLPLASLPLSPIENISSRLMKQDNCLSPKVGTNLNSLAYISVRRR